MASKSFYLVLAISMLILAMNALGDLTRRGDEAIAASPIGQVPQDTATPQSKTTAEEVKKPPIKKAEEPPAEEAKPRTQYSPQSVGLVAGIFGFLVFLFLLLIQYSHRLEQGSYLGRLFHDTIQDTELKRLGIPFTDKLTNGEYRRDINQDSVWMEAHPQPKLPKSPTGYKSTSPTPGEIKQYEEEYARFEEASRTYDSELGEWMMKIQFEEQKRYKIDLELNRKEAKERADRAADVDLAALHGRGSEFVLEFTTIVVIIFAAIVLGILDILKNEQIGTLLAAIAGYVLGRATTRTRSGAGGQITEEEKRTPGSISELTEMIKVVAGASRQADQSSRPVERQKPAEPKPVEPKTAESTVETGSQPKQQT